MEGPTDLLTNNNDVDDDLALSPEALRALQEFILEQSAKQQEQPTEEEFVDEDWQLSQFWYTDDTADSIATEALSYSENGNIACVSTPSIFRALKVCCIQLTLANILKRAWSESAEYCLFEYDKRFSVYKKQFVFYDYKSPLDVPEHMIHSFDVVVLDPPFLSEECFTKAAQTVKLLAKSKDSKIIIMTGTVMTDLLMSLFENLRLCSFKPKHTRPLGNDFSCFCNYDSPSLNTDASSNS